MSDYSSELRQQKSLRLWPAILAYLASIVLMFAAYWMLSSGRSADLIYTAIVLFALLQMFFQVKGFFRVHTNEDRDPWNGISLIFTVIVMVIVVGGSLWIMHNLNYYMMPPMASVQTVVH